MLDLEARRNKGFPCVSMGGLHIEQAHQALHLPVHSHAYDKYCPRNIGRVCRVDQLQV
jgi:hypothetical protein